jgi:iron complex outermembrane receptor protein
MEKPMTRNVQKTLGLIRVALAAGVAFPLFFATSTHAQQPAAAAPAPAPAPPGPGGTEATAERVIVTGSNIPTAEEVGPNPVDTYRRDDITRLGVRTPTDLIQRIPAVTGSNIGENVTNGGSGGATQISLRGIDPKETLVLEDGRRLVPTAGAFVDFNAFPLGLIDHIDILKDGASPIYGTDAVGGVVNVFLIHRFRGLEMYASYGNSNLGFANDFGQETAYMLAGTGDDKTDIVVYAGIYNQASIQNADTNISRDADRNAWGGIDFRSSNLPGRISGRFPDPTSPTGFTSSTRFFLGVFPPLFPAGFPKLLTPTPHAAANQYVDTQYTSTGAIPSERRSFNFGDYANGIAATDREYLYGSMDRDICDKYLTVFADFKYFRSYWDGQLAASPFTPDVWVDSNHPTGISGGGQVGIAVPTQNAFNPFTVPDYVSVGGFVPGIPGTEASAAPAGVGFTTGVKFRGFHDIGRRNDKITTQDYLFTGGLKGNLGEFANAWEKLKTWEWEFGVRYNELDQSEIFGLVPNLYNLRIALLDTNPATAFNPFGVGQNTAAARNFVYTNLLTRTIDQLLTEDYKLTGEAFDLPGGPVSFAIGGQHQTEHFLFQPDALIQQNQALGFVASTAGKGSRDIWAAFWETRIPVTGPTWNFPGAHSFELGYAERFEEYSDFHKPVERPKFDVRWQPFDEALTLRAAYMEAYHAPGLNELFGPTTQSFQATSDKASNVAGITQAQTFFRPNPGLQPELAYEYTYGGVITPGKWWAPLTGLTVSVDYLHIDLRDYAAIFNSDAIIAQANAGVPGFLFLDKPPVGINGLPWIVRSSTPAAPGLPGEILLINDPISNLGRFVMSSWDYEAVYILETNRFGHGDWGTFTTTFNGTYLADVDIQLFQGGKRKTIVGQFGTGFQGSAGFASFPHHKWYSSVFYDGPAGSWMQGIDAGVVVHYVGDYWDSEGDTFIGARGFESGSALEAAIGHAVPNLTGATADRKISEFTTVDLILQYTFNLPPPAAQTEVAGYAKDGGKNVKMKDGKEKNVLPVSTAEYNPCGWRAWLNNMTLTLGVDNVADLEPPFVAGSIEGGDVPGYDASQANMKGRFWYAAIKKRF